MRYIRLFEYYNSISFDDIDSIFSTYEDDGYKIHIINREIVKGRNDISGNFFSSDVVEIYGESFIMYSPNTKMSNRGIKYEKTDCIIVSLSKNFHFDNDIDDENFDEVVFDKWKNEINKKISNIELRCKKILNMSVYGIIGEHYFLGKMSHSDFVGEDFYGKECVLTIARIALFPNK